MITRFCNNWGKVIIQLSDRFELSDTIHAHIKKYQSMPGIYTNGVLPTAFSF